MISSKYYNMLVYLLFDSMILTELLNSYGTIIFKI